LSLHLAVALDFAATVVLLLPLQLQLLPPLQLLLPSLLPLPLHFSCHPSPQAEDLLLVSKP
jgi:hypothetical protein